MSIKEGIVYGGISKSKHFKCINGHAIALGEPYYFNVFFQSVCEGCAIDATL